MVRTENEEAGRPSGEAETDDGSRFVSFFDCNSSRVNDLSLLILTSILKRRYIEETTWRRA